MTIIIKNKKTNPQQLSLKINSNVSREKTSGDSLDFNAGDAGVAVNADVGVLVCGHAVREDDGGAVGQKHLELLRVEGDDNLDER